MKMRRSEVVLLLAIIFLLVVLVVRQWVDPWRQNYYTPWVDITCEGP